MVLLHHWLLPNFGSFYYLEYAGVKRHINSSLSVRRLLPTLSKLFDKLIEHRLQRIVAKLIPIHHFSFRLYQATIEQIHWVIDKIQINLETIKYCFAAFMNISQALIRCGTPGPGLLLKLKQIIPLNYYPILKSYLIHRFLYSIQMNNPNFAKLTPAFFRGANVLGALLNLLISPPAQHCRWQPLQIIRSLQPFIKTIIAYQMLQELLNQMEAGLRRPGVSVYD